jgi:predicted kinase
MELILFIGIPASGKSSFYKERFFRTHLRLNLDQLRSRTREWRLFEAALQSATRLVIDNTNLTPELRARYIEPARSNKYRIIGYFFSIAPNEAAARNTSRAEAERVPEKVIRSMHARLRPPEAAEGFDELFRVSSDRNDTFRIERLL